MSTRPSKSTAKKRDSGPPLFQRILEQAPAALFFVDNQERIAFANAEAARLLGLSGPEDLICKAVEDCPALTPSGIGKEIRRCLEERGPGTTMVSLGSGSEKARLIRMRTFPVPDAEGRPAGAGILLEDLSEIRGIESHLQQSHRLESMGLLAGGIAHDFNNILWMILGNTELAAAEIPVGHPARYNLERVESACRRAQELITQILQFNRQASQNRIPLKLGTIVKESLQLLRSTVPAQIHIRHHIPPMEDTVLADLSAINQMLLQLYTNAAQTMTDRGGVLEVSLVDVEMGPEEIASFPGLNAGRYLILTVMDTGPGMDEDVLGRIFDPFFTAKTPDHQDGMGLAIVNSIAKSHGGVVTVQSRKGQGTIVHVVFPAHCIRQGGAAVSGDPTSKGSGRILFVDDEPDVLELGQSILSRLGYEVTAAQSPGRAVSLFAQSPEKFDLVITDQSMPEITGLRLAERLRKLRPDIRILLCTGYGEQGVEAAARSAHIDRVLSKPLTIKDLAGVLSEMLRGSKEEVS